MGKFIFLWLFVCASCSFSDTSRKNHRAKINKPSNNFISSYAPANDAEKRDAINRVQSYFNGLQNITAEFIQQKIEQSGRLISSEKGKIYLVRHKKEMASMRIDYDKTAQRLIAEKGELKVFDLKSKEVESYSLRDIPALFILNKTVSLYKDCDVKNVLVNDDIYQIVTKPHSSLGAPDVELTLVFARKPFFMFVGWILKDDHNTITVVSFMKDKVRINTKMPHDIFNISGKH